MVSKGFIILLIGALSTMPCPAQSSFENKFMQWGILQYPPAQRTSKQKSGIASPSLRWLSETGSEVKKYTFTPIQNEVLAFKIENAGKKQKVRIEFECRQCQGLKIRYPRSSFAIDQGEVRTIPAQFRFYKGRQKLYHGRVLLRGPENNVVSEISFILRHLEVIKCTTLRT